MYVVYWDEVCTNHYTRKVFVNPTDIEFVGSKLGPSECQWIVPGTINPKDD